MAEPKCMADQVREALMEMSRNSRFNAAYWRALAISEDDTNLLKLKRLLK